MQILIRYDREARSEQNLLKNWSQQARYKYSSRVGKIFTLHMADPGFIPASCKVSDRNQLEHPASFCFVSVIFLPEKPNDWWELVYKHFMVSIIATDLLTNISWTDFPSPNHLPILFLSPFQLQNNTDTQNLTLSYSSELKK